MSNQNWFAVGIDFVIVVVGVFIGLQAANWNDSRIEEELEVNYLERLIIDVQRSREHTNAVTNKEMLERAEDVKLVIASLDSCELTEEHKDRFARGVFGLGRFETAYLDTTAIDELKSTGRWAVIGNGEVQESIEKVSRHIDYQARVQPQFVMMVGPPVQYVLKHFRFQVDGPDSAEPAMITAEKANYNFEQLCEDPRILASVTLVQSMMYGIVEWNQRITALMKDAEQKLEEELAAQMEG